MRRREAKAGPDSFGLGADIAVTLKEQYVSCRHARRSTLIVCAFLAKDHLRRCVHTCENVVCLAWMPPCCRCSCYRSLCVRWPYSGNGRKYCCLRDGAMAGHGKSGQMHGRLQRLADMLRRWPRLPWTSRSCSRSGSISDDGLHRYCRRRQRARRMMQSACGLRAAPNTSMAWRTASRRARRARGRLSKTHKS